MRRGPCEEVVCSFEFYEIFVWSEGGELFDSPQIKFERIGHVRSMCGVARRTTPSCCCFAAIEQIVFRRRRRRKKKKGSPRLLPSFPFPVPLPLLQSFHTHKSTSKLKISPCPSARKSRYSSGVTRDCPGRRTLCPGTAADGSAGGRSGCTVFLKG